MIYVLMLLCGLLAWSLLLPKAELRPFDVKSTLPLRGLLAILIVAHHVAPLFTPPRFESFKMFHSFFCSVGAPVVSVFFLITGYGLAKSLQVKGKAYLDGFMQKRLSSMLPELIVVSAFIMTMCMTFGDSSLWDYAERFKRGVPPTAESWYIYAVIAVYAAFYISHSLCSDNRKLAGIIFTLCILGLTYLPYQLDWPFHWFRSTVSVAIGYWFGVYEKKMERMLFNQLSIIFIIGIWASLYYMLRVIPAIQMMMAFAFSSIAVYMCIRRYGFPQSPVFIFLGGISLNIYLVHPLSIIFAQKVGIDGQLAMAVVMALSVAGAFALKQCRQYVEAMLAGSSRKRILE